MGKDDEAKVFLLPHCCLIKNTAYDNRLGKKVTTCISLCGPLGLACTRRNRIWKNCCGVLQKKPGRTDSCPNGKDVYKRQPLHRKTHLLPVSFPHPHETASGYRPRKTCVPSHIQRGSFFHTSTPRIQTFLSWSRSHLSEGCFRTFFQPPAHKPGKMPLPGLPSRCV